jgi:hypothetical protein
MEFNHLKEKSHKRQSIQKLDDLKIHQHGISFMLSFQYDLNSGTSNLSEIHFCLATLASVL